MTRLSQRSSAWRGTGGCPLPVLLGLAFFLSAFSVPQIDVESEKQAQAASFPDVVKRAAIEIVKASPGRPYRLKAMNDSLASMAEAVKLMASSGDYAAIRALLSAAQNQYPDNVFAVLMEAILVNSRGTPGDANRVFERFLIKSRTYSEFEKPFLKWGEFHALRRSVYELLKARGVQFKGREKEILVKIPFEDFFHFLRNPGSFDQSMCYGFFVALLIGGAGLLIFGIQGGDFSRHIALCFLLFYLAIWIAYGLWLLDLFFGLPWGWTRFYAVPVFLAVMLVLDVSFLLKGMWDEYHRPLEKGYRRCPGCRAVVERVRVECPACRRALDV